MLLELGGPRQDRGWRHVHLVRCFSFPRTIDAAMRVPGTTTPTNNIGPTTIMTATSTTTKGSITLSIKRAQTGPHCRRCNDIDDDDDIAGVPMADTTT